MDRQSASQTDATQLAYLQDLWSTQLNLPTVGLTDDFFDAGGSSMQVIEMLMAVTQRFGRDIDYPRFLEKPCIHTLTELLAD